MSDNKIIKGLYIDLCQASIDKNLNTLNSILSEDYILVHMTGMKQTKEEYLHSVSIGELKYYDVKHESIDVIIDGNKAKIIGKTKTLASPFGASKSWWNLEQKLEIEKINGQWLIKKSVVSMY